MINRIKKLLFLSIICLIIFAVIYSFLVKRYVIRGFSFSYIICVIIIFCALLIGLNFVDKYIKQNNAAIIFKLLILAFVTVFSCFIVCGIGNALRDEEQFYNIPVDGISDKYEITLYEYNSFGSNSGCLCVKINDLIYKKIPETSYTIEYGYSLALPGNLAVDYDSETQKLFMRYRWKDSSEYCEVISMINLDS